MDDEKLEDKNEAAINQSPLKLRRKGKRLETQKLKVVSLPKKETVEEKIKSVTDIYGQTLSQRKKQFYSEDIENWIVYHLKGFAKFSGCIEMMKLLEKMMGNREKRFEFNQ